MITDRDRPMLAAVASGDPEGLRALFERHGDALLGYLTGLLGDALLAEEVLQDTLVAVWRAAAGFVGGSSVRTWMYAVARRRAVDAMRRRSRSLPATGDAALVAVAASEPGPEQLVLARADIDQVASAIRRLSPVHREVLLLACVHELSGPEIASVLGIALGTVKSRLSNARASLARLVATDHDNPDGV